MFFGGLLGQTFLSSSYFEYSKNNFAGVCNLWSVHNNQGAVAFMEEPEIGICYKQGYINEQNIYLLAGILPVQDQCWGGIISYFGYEHYYEMNLGITYARKLYSNFSAGIQINYFQFQIAQANINKHYLYFNLGILYNFDQKLNIGITLNNPTSAFLKDEYDPLSSSLRFGMNYRLTKKTQILTEIEKPSDYQLIYKLGFVYHFNNFFAIDAGYFSGPHKIGCGFLLDLKKLTLNMDCSYHVQLGLKPAISLKYRF